MNLTNQANRRLALYFFGVLAIIGAPLLIVWWTSWRASPASEFVNLMNVGKNYYDRGEASKAIESFQQAVHRNPAHADAQLNLANAFLLGGQSEKAIPPAQEVLRLDHNSAAAHYIIGCAHLRLRQFEPALKALQQAKAIDPAVGAVGFQLGRAHQELSHWDDAIREFQELLSVAPDHPAAHYSLSQALIRAGRPAEANEELEKHRQVLAKNPGASKSAEAYERCQHTEARVPFQLEQPAKRGIKVRFADATPAALGNAAQKYRGPVGVLDFNHDGRNSLFVAEGAQGFRLLENKQGTFQPRGELLPGVAGAKYYRCLVGDLQPSANDRFEDVLVLGDKGVHVYKSATNGTLTEVTGFSGLNGVAAVDGVLLDLDFTGKLDLITVSPGSNVVRVFRNLGNLYFKDNTTNSVSPTNVAGALRLTVDDWDNDDLLDIILARAGQPPALLMKQRGGPLAVTNSPADWPAGSLIAAGDFNNDLRADLVIGTSDKLVIVFGGMSQRLTMPLEGLSVTSLTVLDFDNDGWLDILGAGDGLHVWRNLSQAGFHDVTKKLGLAKLARGRIESVTAADFDGDCDTDLLLSVEGQGLQLLRNDGGNANQQLKVRLLGNRSNPSGLGIRVEVTAGGLRLGRRVASLPVEIGVAKHTFLESLNARWFNLNVNNVDVKVEGCSVIPLIELTLQEGSCPYLYAWDGHRFRFVTDLLGTAPLGLRLTEDRFIDADTDELVWIGNETTFAPAQGNYVLQITEELREVLYLDEAKLVAVDHPAGTEVHPAGKLVPGKPWPSKEIVTLRNRTALRRATRHDGSDVTGLLNDIDSRLLSPTQLRAPQLRGLAEPHSVTLDFGPLAGDRPLVLALTGWLRFGGGTANVAASHHPDLPFPFPTLEVEMADGEWKPVNVVVGAPSGKTKTIVVDLTGHLPAGGKRLRVSMAFEIHWDRIALFERADAAETKLARLSADYADLHWHGFGNMEDRPWNHPITPNYDQVNQAPKWRITPMGWCTRYGDVKELIDHKDNALALLNGGDEVTLKFAADRLPPKREGFVRDFFLFSVGWDKDSDFHCEQGWLVEPLPWHGMDDQLYGRQPRPVIDGDWWIKKYNTRWVGLQTVQRNQK